MQPDLEAQTIKYLFERIKELEAQIESLKAAKANGSSTERKEDVTSKSNLLIEEFLDGAGI